LNHEVAVAVVERYFDGESLFSEAVNRGEKALQNSEFLTHEQVGLRLERYLQP
jgi:hypothetical protein